MKPDVIRSSRIVKWYALPSILLSLGITIPLFSMEESRSDFSYWCVLERRERTYGTEITTTALERTLSLSAGGVQSEPINLSGYSAHAKAQNGALILTLLGPIHSRSDAVAELPIKRLQTSLYERVAKQDDLHIVFTCEHRN